MKRINLESLNLSLSQILVIFFLILLPSRFKVMIYRLAGASIGKKASIGIGTIVLAESFKKINIGNYTSIRNFSIIICGDITIGKYSEIAPFTWIWGSGKLNIGNKCYIGPRCIINLRRNNFYMGNYAGVGPSSVIYTHGQWLPYTQGWPRKYGDVKLEDYAWVPARVFISPGVTIGKESIIGSGAVVTKSIPPRTFAAGVPAKVISEIEKFKDLIDDKELFNRAIEIARDLVDFFGFKMLSEKRIDLGYLIEFQQKKLFSIKRWIIFISDASKINPQQLRFISGRDVILFSTSKVREEIGNEFMSWFDLKNIESSAIDHKFSFNIWNFLRQTWCITCDIAHVKCARTNDKVR